MNNLVESVKLILPFH